MIGLQISMGCRWSEVQILSPRPIQTNEKASYLLVEAFSFAWIGREMEPKKRFTKSSGAILDNAKRWPEGRGTGMCPANPPAPTKYSPYHSAGLEYSSLTGLAVQNRQCGTFVVCAGRTVTKIVFCLLIRLADIGSQNGRNLIAPIMGAC